MPPGLTLDRVGRLAEREQPGDGDAHQCRNPGCSRREALTHPGQGRHRPRDWLAEYLDYDSSIFRCYEPYRKRTLARLCWRMQAILEWYNARKKSSKRVQVRRRVMSMYAGELGPIPEETERVAHAACPKGTLAMRLRDALGELYQDEQFAALYPVEGQPAYEPWRLAVVTVLQYAENLTDRQAADAVRERIDWKYSLGLDLSDPGFDFSLLSEFRLRLVEAGAETLLLDRLLEVCKQRGWLKAGGKQRTDSTHVLARVRSLSNLECVGETLRPVLDDLAPLAPEYLVQQINPDWVEPHR